MIQKAVVAIPALLPLPGLFALLTLVTLFVFPPFALVFLAFTLIFALSAWLRFRNTEYALTDRRVLIRVGWFNRRSSEILLNKVESIHIQQDPFGRKFGYGDIVVTGTGGSNEVITEMDKPFDFYRLLQEQLPKAKAGG